MKRVEASELKGTTMSCYIETTHRHTYFQKLRVIEEGRPLVASLQSQSVVHECASKH